MTPWLLALAITASPVATSTGTLAKYRQAALTNAAAAELALSKLDACEIEREAAERLVQASPARAEPAISPWVWGLAGLGVGIAVGSVAMAAALGGQGGAP